MPEARERNQPRISVTKLAEYMTASPRGRKSIIANQKRPRDFIVLRYTEALDAIVAHLTSGKSDLARIQRKIRLLREASATTTYERQKHDLCAEALERFMKVADRLRLDGVRAIRGSTEQPQLNVAGVSVSIRPEVLLLSVGEGQETPVGAFKIYLSKHSRLSEESGLYASTALHQFARQHIGANLAAQRCTVVDVFAGMLFSAPRAFKKRWQDIEAACEEIARAWASA